MAICCRTLSTLPLPETAPPCVILPERGATSGGAIGGPGGGAGTFGGRDFFPSPFAMHTGAAWQRTQAAVGCNRGEAPAMHKAAVATQERSVLLVRMPLPVRFFRELSMIPRSTQRMKSACDGALSLHKYDPY